MSEERCARNKSSFARSITPVNAPWQKRQALVALQRRLESVAEPGESLHQLIILGFQLLHGGPFRLESLLLGDLLVGPQLRGPLGVLGRLLEREAT